VICDRRWSNFLNTRTRQTSGATMQHPQDDLLVAEALIRHAHDLEKGEPIRAERAWQLAEDVACEHGMSLSDVMIQIE